MTEIIQSETFKQWLLGLKDRTARARILIRIKRIETGNLGDVKPVGEGMSELRIDHGRGYRLYFMQREQRVIILLCGGDKSTQMRDIDRARMIAEDWRD